jgi:hypothetical protein
LRGLPVADYFVQRDVELQQLEAFFQTTSQETRRKVFVIDGLGGMGKTQLCVEYIRKHKDDFSAILWLDGSSKAALRQSLREAASRMPESITLPSMSTRAPSETSPLVVDDMDTSIQLLLSWLSKPDNTGWLLVFDNVDREWQSPHQDPQAFDFKQFLPWADHGNVLLTTRLTRLHLPESSIHLQSVNSDLGRRMLEMRLGKRLAGTTSLSLLSLLCNHSTNK